MRARLALLLMVALLVALVAGCTQAKPAAPVPAVPTAVPATDVPPTAAPSPVPPTAVPTPIPPSPTAMPPTPTTAPTTQGITLTAPLAAAPSGPLPGGALPAPQPQRIAFASGATSATVQGQLGVGGIQKWVLRVLQGQTMSVNLTPTNGVAKITIVGADGSVLLSDHADALTWSGRVPITGDYVISVIAASGFAPAYLLQVTIPPLVVPTPPAPVARRIRFASGAASATVEGGLAPNGSDLWVLRVLDGQLMSVSLHPSGGRAHLLVYGANGAVLLSEHAGATSWSGTIPSTQDYYVKIVAEDGTAPAYTMEVTVPPQAAPTAQPNPAARRISFAAGATSATVSGALGANGSDAWVLRASARQYMSVSLHPSGGSALLIIYGADGAVLLSDHAGAMVWSGLLPTTQDYNIRVVAYNGAPTYTLTVSILPLSR